MDTMYRKSLTINFRWRIPAEQRLIDLQEQLDEDAFERITSAMEAGQMCGELHTYFKDEDGVETPISGWWSLKEGSADENT